jgi:single-strand DNA-binding protein
MYINKAMIYGNLTRDPEQKALPSGMAVTNLSIATNRTWKDKDGNKQESVDYHEVVIFGKMAENVAHYLKRGSSAYIEGRLQTRSWKTDSGENRYKTEVIAESVQFGPKRGDVGENTGNTGDTSTKEEVNEEEISPDDIPF